MSIPGCGAAAVRVRGVCVWLCLQAGGCWLVGLYICIGRVHSPVVQARAG
jgi:hypothetical protein